MNKNKKKKQEKITGFLKNACSVNYIANLKKKGFESEVFRSIQTYWLSKESRMPAFKSWNFPTVIIIFNIDNKIIKNDSVFRN